MTREQLKHKETTMIHLNGSKTLRSMVAGAVLTTLLVGGAPAQDMSLHGANPSVPFDDVGRGYSELDEHFVRSGTSRTPQQVQQIHKGQTQTDLVRVLGQPVSHGTDGEWNFNISLPLPQGNAIVCQYKVFFDNNRQVVGGCGAGLSVQI